MSTVSAEVRQQTQKERDRLEKQVQKKRKQIVLRVLGGRCKTIRELAGMSPSEIAAKLNGTLGGYSLEAFESGDADIPVLGFFDLLEALGSEIDLIPREKTPDYETINLGDLDEDPVGDDGKRTGKRHGNRYWKRKLDVPRVRELRQTVRTWEDCKREAAVDGVRDMTIWRAVTGKTWKHVDTPPVDVPRPRDKTPKREVKRKVKTRRKTLSEALVRRVKILLVHGKSQTEVSQVLNIPTSTVHDIDSGRTWSHVEVQPRSTSERPSDDEVREIRDLGDAGLSYSELARWFNINPSTSLRYVKRQIRADV